MRTKYPGRRALARTAAVTLALTALGASAQADPGHFPPPGGGHFPPPHGGGSSLAPGNLLVSRSVYENDQRSLPTLRSSHRAARPAA